MKVAIYILGNKLDLFDEQNIEINSSIKSVKDIASNSTDYTKTFTVPASDVNNAIFKHYYDATIDNSFDARIKIDADIRLYGFIFKRGKIRLSKVVVKSGKPYSYTINFWGNLLSLKDKLLSFYLKDLNLSAYDHTYNSANIKIGLKNSLLNGDIIYNLIVKKQYYYTTDVNDTTTTDAYTNIAWGNGSGLNGINYSDLKPSLRVIRIIEAIENDFNITFSRHFFGLSEFTNLFLYINKDDNKNETAGGVLETINFDSGDTTNISLVTNTGGFTVSSINDFISWRLDLTITPSSGFLNTPYTLRLIADGDVYSEVTYQNGGVQTFSNTLISTSPQPHTYVVRWELESASEIKYTADILQIKLVNNSAINFYNTSASESAPNINFKIKQNIPNIKILDFLKGLFKMFNLIAIPQDDGSIYIDTTKNYYAKGNVVDITNYVNNEKIEIKRGEIFNEINFLFEKTKTILNDKFKINNGNAYGDETAVIKDANNNLLDGNKFEIKVPFETILFERLNDVSLNKKTNIQYGAIIDKNMKPLNPNLVMFYNINVDLGIDELGFIDENNSKSKIIGSLNVPSHSDNFLNPNFSVLFGKEFSTWNGLSINNSLYKNYYEDYILDVFNKKTRAYKFDAILPLNKMLNLKLNDFIKIKNDFYRIDNYTTNLVSGKVNFNLINSFNSTNNQLTANPSTFIVDKNQQKVTSNVVGYESLTYMKSDSGSGVNWISISKTDNILYFDITQNNSGNSRFMKILLFNKEKINDLTITFQQNG